MAILLSAMCGTTLTAYLWHEPYFDQMWHESYCWWAVARIFLASQPVAKMTLKYRETHVVIENALVPLEWPLGCGDKLCLQVSQFCISFSSLPNQGHSCHRRFQVQRKDHTKTFSWIFHRCTRHGKLIVSVKLLSGVILNIAHLCKRKITKEMELLLRIQDL